MASPPSQLAAIVSLAAVLTQIACEGRTQSDDADASGGDGPSGSGGVVGGGGVAAVGTGGSGDSNGTGGSGDVPEGSGGTGGCELSGGPPHSTVCGEGASCQIGDSYPGGSGPTGDIEECPYVLEAGPTGACEPIGTTMGVCNECFCQDHEWFCWRLTCP